MRHFYVRDENNLAILHSFVFQQGQAPLIRTPTFGGYVFQQGRPSPDTFTIHDSSIRIVAGTQFTVVDNDLTVYECICTTVSNTSGQIQISGIVSNRWPIQAENRSEALRMIGEATET